MNPDYDSDSTAEDRIWEKLRLKTGDPRTTSQTPQGYLLLQLPRQPHLPLEHQLEWVKKPFRYQIEGIEMLLSREALLLADDMGLGKTLQAISAIRILAYKKLLAQALIVVPVGLISQWRREIRLLAPELRLSTIYGPLTDRAYQWNASAQIFLTGFETLREDFTDNPQSPPGRQVWDLVVLDEAQRIKNKNTEIARKCKMLWRKRAWALTGTPLENRVEDLASILEFTRPHLPGVASPGIIPGTRMRELHRNLQLRRKKGEVLQQLPPKTVSTVLLPLTAQQRRSYDQAEKAGILELTEKGAGVSISNILELILRLKQICNFCPLSEESSKMDDLLERIETLLSEGHRALIFSQFVDTKFGVQAIARRLRQFHPLVYSGALNRLAKDRLINQFKTDPSRQVMVLSLRAGAQGLNLQEASYVFHFDRWWNPALEHHAEDRAHRQGQTSPVHVYRYTCENTIEERIETILQTKQGLFNDLVDDVTIDLRMRLTEEDLFGLFGLPPPPAAGRKFTRT
jgi:SNF2 family DNA or RNA helicase